MLDCIYHSCLLSYYLKMNYQYHYVPMYVTKTTMPTFPILSTADTVQTNVWSGNEITLQLCSAFS